MSRIRTAGLIPLALAAGLLAAPSAHADGAVVRFVQSSAADCADAGPGDQAQPYCTLQAALSAAQPGDTVMVVEATDDAVLSRSGTPDAPITLTSADMSSVSTGTLALQSVHDVRISRFRGSGTLHIADSRQVSVESSELADISGPAVGSVDITGSSADVTLRQTYVLNFNAPYAVQVGAGTQRVTLSTNVLRAPVRLSGTSDALVAGNSVTASGTWALTVSGGSAGTVLVDNVFNGPLKADPDSLQGMRESYDNVRPGSDGTLYDWGGTAYTTVTAFQAAPGGFGVQDLVTAPSAAARNYDNWVDAADETAPGELPTDVNGRPRVDNTLVPNTGTGSGTWDRGAEEVQDPIHFYAPSPSPDQAPTGTAITLPYQDFNPWRTPVSATVDWGDGTTRSYAAGTLPSHVYTKGAAGGQTYAITETKRVEGSSYQQTFTTQVVISPPGPMTVKDTPGIRIPDARHPLTIDASTFGTLFFSPWGIAGETMDFGDGTGTVPVDASNMLHTYARPGRYRVTQTATDRIGRTISASAVAQVGAAFAAVAPARLLDTRNGTGAAKGRPGAHSVIRLTVTGHGVPSGATSVLLNLTAVGSAAPGYVTAYPHGRPRPTASSLDYRRGQTIANLVSVPVGANGQVDLYVSAGPVDLVADVEGYQSTAPTGPAGFFTSYLGQHGEWTNWWGAPRLAADGTRTLQVVPPELTNLQQYDMGYGATAVVLRLTVSKPGSAGYLTAYRAGTARPGTSVLNFSQGEDRSATAVVPVGPDGKVSVYAHAGRPILLSVAVEGFYAPELADSQFHVMTTPVRVLDTRTGLGHRGRLAASTDWRFKVSGAAGLPSGVTGVLVNLTAVNPTAPGSLWAWADGNHRPVEEALRYQRGQVTAGLVWLPVVNGYLRLSSDYGTLDVVADIEGYALG